MKGLFLIIACLSFFAFERSFAVDAVGSTLDHAEKLFEEGEYEKAEKSLSALGKGPELEGSLESWYTSDVRRYFLLRARLAYAFGREGEMKQALTRLFEEAPDTSLDPLKDPPQAHTIWRSLQKDRVPSGKKDAASRTTIQNQENKNQHPDKPAINDEKPLTEKFRSLDDALRQKSRFWIGLAPFGIGHFDDNKDRLGFVYLSSEVGLMILSAEIARKEESIVRKNLPKILSEDAESPEKNGDVSLNSEIAVPLGFIGLWGYEVNDLMPELYKRDPEKAAWMRYAQSFFPFGVGQKKNGDQAKAIGVAVAESLFLSIGIFSGNEKTRELAMRFFWVTFVYGAYDGWANHKWQYTPPTAASNFNFSVVPVLVQDTTSSRSSRASFGLCANLSYTIK